MPKGGRRPGAGRPRGSPNRRTSKLREAVAEAVAVAEASGVTPLQHMMQVLNSNAPDARKDQMAMAAAPFCHPRLAMTASVNAPANSCGPLQIAIFSVPHGAQIVDGRIVWPDGAPATAEETAFRPYKPTPALPALPDQSAAVEPLEVLEPAPDDGKITPLNAWRRRDDGPT